MYTPTIEGLIDRRILITYRVDPAAAASCLPPPFEPQLVRGHAVAGVCLIRLAAVRPRKWPSSLGLTSENAAHRFAVSCPSSGGRQSGVYIPRRDTSSRLNVLAGGWVFPGAHHHAHFEVCESADRYHVQLNSDDRAVAVSIDARPTDAWRSELFATLEEASDFYRRGSCGYSPTMRPHHYDALELCCDAWDAVPLAVDGLRSSFFDDRRLFPPGSISFDHALLMRGIPHQWRSLGQFSGTSAAALASACDARSVAEPTSSPAMRALS